MHLPRLLPGGSVHIERCVVTRNLPMPLECWLYEWPVTFQFLPAVVVPTRLQTHQRYTRLDLEMVHWKTQYQPILLLRHLHVPDPHI